MPVSVVIDSLDNIPTLTKDDFKEVDGKFVLDLDDSFEKHPNIEPMRNTLARLKDDKSKLSEDLKAAKSKLSKLPDDFDYEDIEQAVKDAKKQGDAKLQAAVEKMQAEMQERDKAIEGYQARERQGLIKSEIGEVFAKEGVTDPLDLADALDVFSTRHNIEVEDGQAFVDTDLGRKPLADVAKNWDRLDRYVSKATSTKAPGSQVTGKTDKKLKDLTPEDRMAALRDGKSPTDLIQSN